MVKVKLIIVSLLSLIFVGCAGCGGEKTAPEVRQLRPIEIPKAPAMMSEEEQLDYLAKHYWDNFDFADTAYVAQSDILEQFYADYINILYTIPNESAVSYVEALYKDAGKSKRVFEYFMDVGEKYLYVPNSPYRNEELYIPILEAVMAYDSLSDLEKVRSERQLEMSKRNREGDQAADFRITLANGSSINLHQIGGEYILLYFINPGCGGCAQETLFIEASEIIAPMIKDGRLKVVLVYPDSDLEAWREDQENVPSDWLYGYDKELKIRDEDIYDLQAIPTFYLLDRDKVVLIKDAKGVIDVERYLYYEAQM